MQRPTRFTILLLLALSVGATASAGADTAVYTDSLAEGWQNWSWSTTVNFTNASPVHGSGGSSIFAQYTSAWAGLYLHRDLGLAAGTFTTLRFSIHGGTTGGQQIRLVAYQGTSEAGSVNLPAPAAGAWTDMEIAISSLVVTTINGLVWQDASGGPQPVFYLDDILLVGGEPPPPGTAPVLSVDVGADRHAISPYIYGMNFADDALASELDLPVSRWGGNATTRYNWQNDTSNRSRDWYFENIPDDNPDPALLPNGSSADRFVESNRARGTDSIITVPLIGWTPKTRDYACGFSVAKYGPQQSVDPWRPDCGNGKRPDGTDITGNDPADTSVSATPSFVTGWINHLQTRYGTASTGGVKFYNLDNEPMLWNDTHRDVHPAPTSYDEIRDRTFMYAAAIKAADPAALTLGPVLWGWTAYFYSAADTAAGGSWWDTRPDRKAHGDMPFVEWYLQQMRQYQIDHGARILDYLDLHYYPQAGGVALSTAGSTATQSMRLRSTRSLWDPTYVDESWISDTVRLLPRMRDWVNTFYPGTKLALTEYNWGGHEHMSGALALADVLGIFGRERLDLATLWDPPASNQPAAYAFRMYRTYDGADGRFGELSVRAASTDPSTVSAFASTRSNDGRLTVMLINKTAGSLDCPFTLANYPVASFARVYRYSAADATHIVRDADIAASSSITLSLPAASINLVVFTPAGPPSDFDRDGDVDPNDLAHFLHCALGPRIAPSGTSCTDADLDGDGDADQVDFAALQRCFSGIDIPAAASCR